MSAALIMPQILATLHVTLKGTAHARAISLYGGIGGVAFIIGQMGGGWLVSADIAGLGWRNAFFINVPISLLVLALSHRYVPETRNETPTRIDWQGTFALALILCCLLFPLSLSPDLGWPWQSQVALLAIIPLTLWMRAGALRQERNGLHPLMPRLLKLASIRFGLLIALLFFCAWSGFMFCMALTLQAGVGMAPWQSGNSFVVLGIVLFRLGLLCAETDRPSQPAYHSAEWHCDSNKRPGGSVRYDLVDPRPSQRPESCAVHRADWLRPGVDREQFLPYRDA
jgi:MFS family permease